jgi:ADP-ribose pyrophosphatase
MRLYSGKYLRVLKKDNWEYVERTHSNEAVVILAITEDKKVILTEQFRIPLGKNVIELPAGLLNDPGSVTGETKEQAAMRELLEETGYEAQEMEFILSGPPSPGLSSEVSLFYWASGLKKTGTGGGVEGEKIIVHEVPIKEVDGWLQGMEAQGKLVDPKVYAGLYLIKEK